MNNLSVHPLALLIPTMTNEEYTELKFDIQQNGLLTPITLYEDKILDGRHRYQACQELALTPTFDYYNGSQPAHFVLSKNIFRRNLNGTQKAGVAAKIQPYYEREVQHGGDRRSKDFQEGTNSHLKGDSGDLAGQVIGVSGRYVDKYKKIVAEKPELQAKLDSGELTITGAEKESLMLSSISNEWYTPIRYVEAAREALGTIDVDPASNELANKTIRAKTFYTKENSGLLKEWRGTVWLNPPYGGIATGFVAKLIDQYKKRITTEAILLVNANSTDTGWFQPLWNYVLCFTNHRINFMPLNNKAINNSTHGSVFVYFGKQKQKFIDNFKQFGVVVERIDNVH